MNERLLLPGLTIAELAAVLESPARARAVVRWLYGTPLPKALDGDVPGVSRRLSHHLQETCALQSPEIVSRARGEDGTIKYALRVSDAGRGARQTERSGNSGAPDATIETVLIPARGRSTVCVSSQAGCTRQCRFCATAKLGFKRHLEPWEMVEQYRVALAEAPSDAPLRNVVFMGMGEPMDNLDAVLKAIEVLTQAPAPHLAHGHVTVSTCGVLPGIQRFLRESRANLALSLNATTDECREKLMPHNRHWPIAALLDALREDGVRSPSRVHFVEYVLFEGINDTDADAERLVRLLEGVRARVNLIAHNPVDGCGLGPPGEERLRRFQTIVHGGGVRCLVRVSRGQPIAAACGQLAARSTSPGPARIP